MYRGFNLKIPGDLNRSSLETGRKIKKITNDNVKKSLDSFLLNNGSLDGSKIMEEWFPEIKSHIFLSHSHHDEEKALIIAGLLYEEFKIWTFIDSTVWGYSNDLLRKQSNERVSVLLAYLSAALREGHLCIKFSGNIVSPAPGDLVLWVKANGSADGHFGIMDTNGQVFAARSTASGIGNQKLPARGRYFRVGTPTGNRENYGG